MPQVAQNTFERLSLEITDQAEELILYALLQLRHISERLIENPNASINERRELIRLQNEWQDFISTAEDWLENELADSYIRGIERGNSAGGVVTAGAFASLGLLTPINPPAEPSAKIVERFNKYPEHIPTFSRFKASAQEQLRFTRLPVIRQQGNRIRDIITQASSTAFREGDTRLPVIRQQGNRIRDIITQASSTAFREGDTFTRRQFSQELMRRFSDEGITGITYRNGRRVQLDSYSEMVARTQTQQAFNQANWNRLQERGQDLVVISVHYPCSDLCEPFQGEIFSISGNDPNYPSLQLPINELVFRPNCGHHTSGWHEGDDKPEQDINTAENAEMYRAQQRQRTIERNIKKYKRREVSSVDPREQERSKSFVSKWQAEQRRHVSDNPFLRRDYTREQI